MAKKDPAVKIAEIQSRTQMLHETYELMKNPFMMGFLIFAGTEYLQKKEIMGSVAGTALETCVVANMASAFLNKAQDAASGGLNAVLAVLNALRGSGSGGGGVVNPGNVTATVVPPYETSTPGGLPAIAVPSYNGMINVPLLKM